MGHSVARVKNDPDVMEQVVPIEGLYVIQIANDIEQIGNLVSGVAPVYTGGGTFAITGLVVGRAYVWTKGANDTSLTTPGGMSQDGTYPQPQQVLTATGNFVAQATTATLAGTPAAAITATLIPDVFIQKLWAYPFKSFAAGVGTVNGANIRLGKSGAGAGVTQFLPDVLQPTDLVIEYTFPLGQKLALSQVIVRGAAGDGCFFQFT